MKKSCKYCGRVHDEDFICPLKPQRKYKNRTDKLSQFRSSKQWQEKREDIKRRDQYLCQVCLLDKVLNYQKIEVHHIVPMEVDFEKRLDDDNLISLCPYHHHLAEKGKIKKEKLKEIVEHISPLG